MRDGGASIGAGLSTSAPRWRGICEEWSWERELLHGSGCEKKGRRGVRLWQPWGVALLFIEAEYGYRLTNLRTLDAKVLTGWKQYLREFPGAHAQVVGVTHDR